MKKFLSIWSLLWAVTFTVNAQNNSEKFYPSNTEFVIPSHKENFNNSGVCRERKQGGNPKEINGYLTFNGSMDGKKQVDPQIAVGGGYILEGTNRGLLVFDKKGNYLQGVSQRCFKDGIDPKMFFDIHNGVFVFDFFDTFIRDKSKPVNISVSETSNPLGAWNTYSVARPTARDGGAIGYSKKWIGYTYPGKNESLLVMRMADAIAGKSTTMFHFKGGLGQPLFMQDPLEDLYFFKISGDEFIITKLSEDAQGTPYIQEISRRAHNLEHMGVAKKSPQKGTEDRVSSGAMKPKNAVLQNGSIWISQVINYEGRAAVQWHQINPLTAEIIQTGLIKSDTMNYIQSSIAVNKKNDVLIGFQSVNENSFISPRFAYRKAKDPKGTIREIVSAGEGKAASLKYRGRTNWGDYSGSIIDGDNKKVLWTIQRIADEKGNGATVIVKVPIK